MPSPHTALRRRARAGLAVAALLLAGGSLAACGGDSITDTTVPPTFAPNSMLDMNPKTPSNDTIAPPPSVGGGDAPGQGPGSPDRGGDSSSTVPSSTLPTGPGSQ